MALAIIGALALAPAFQIRFGANGVPTRAKLHSAAIAALLISAALFPKYAYAADYSTFTGLAGDFVSWLFVDVGPYVFMAIPGICVIGVPKRWIAASLAAPISPTLVLEGDRGCQVLLCLTDPRGPEAESPCVRPIEKLWRALAHGDPFPMCNFNPSQADLPPRVRPAVSASALPVGAGVGAANVTIDNCLYPRVWWGVSGHGGE